MISPRLCKKLARVIHKMQQSNKALEHQQDGSFAARIGGKAYARLNAQEARAACAEGVFDRGKDNCLQLNAQSVTWLSRFQAEAASSDNIFAAQHRSMQTVSLIDADGSIHSAQKNVNESPLAWLCKATGPTGKPYLCPAEFAASERLRMDYFASSLSQNLCADWSKPARARTASGPRNTVLDAADAALGAKDRFIKALDILGPGLNDVVFSLCIRETGMEQIECANHWPKRSGKIILKLALDRLARHYGLIR
jgi:Domain of unknown function (DUF6456)